MSWPLFENGGEKYDLSHLDPFDWVVELNERVGGPRKLYKFQVLFSHHTFTSSPENNLGGITYETSFNDRRVFDLNRYELSKDLPEIIRSLDSRRCFLTKPGYRNYFTMDMVQNDGSSREYVIFFTTSKVEKRRGWMRLLVESAYLRDIDKGPMKTNGRKIGFNVIARNTLNNRNINRR